MTNLKKKLVYLKKNMWEDLTQNESMEAESHQIQIV